MTGQNSENKLIEGEDYYLSPEGYKVFTEKFHLKRGYCCKAAAAIARTDMIRKQEHLKNSLQSPVYSLSLTWLNELKTATATEN